MVWVLVALLFAVFNKARRYGFLLLALGILLVFSNGFLVSLMANAYQADYPPMRKHKVGILLGGFSGDNMRNGNIQFAWSGDRFMQALKLLKTGKIEKLLISGGSANVLDTAIKEADLVKQYCQQIGIADSLVLIENQSRNTIENAKYSYAILAKLGRANDVLVITSAWHIPRATIPFKKYFKDGLSFHPTNYIMAGKLTASDYLLPSAASLNDSEILIKEWVGYLVDSLRS